MLHETTQQLIRKLAELTDAGALAWEESEGGASRLETEGYVLEVLGAPPTFRLLRGDGRELERADEAELSAVAWPEKGGTYATGVADMAARASRIARGAEQAIARILSSLSAPPRAPARLPEPAAPRAAFGDIESFAKPPPPAPAPQAVAAPSPVPVPATPSLLAQGISARSTQTVEPASPDDIQRALAPAAPTPHAAPASKPLPTGPDIYKPWS